MFVLLVLWAYSWGGGLGVFALFLTIGAVLWVAFLGLLLFVIGSIGVTYD